MIEILTDSSDLSKIAEKMKSDLVGAEGIGDMKKDWEKVKVFVFS